VITGSVNAYREAVIPVSVRDASGREQQLDAVVDTGFNGSLTLPAAMIIALGLAWRNRGSVVLANGSVEQCDIYAGVVIWDGQPRNILVECAETEPLVGMTLIYGYELNVQVVDGGLVLLTLI
jgi:clan AA aspartic protease